jgi:Beta-propeller repeat
MAIDKEGDIYVTGQGRSGTGRGEDAFVAKYNPAGTQLWLKFVGSAADDSARDIAVDDNKNVYITGYTLGTFGASSFGDADAFVAKFDTAGNQQWVHQLGTAAADYAYGIASDRAGNIAIVGATKGGLNDRANTGGFDVLVARYNTNGILQTAESFGSVGEDVGSKIAIDNQGAITIARSKQSLQDPRSH